MKEKLAVLLVDDDDEDAFLTRELLSDATGIRFDVEHAGTHEAGLAALVENRHDVCLMDYRLNGRTGLEVLKDAQDRGCNVPAIMLTGAGNRSVDLAAMEIGVSEYLVKGEADAPLLERAIRYTIAHKADERELAEQNERLKQLDAQKNRLLGMAVHDLRNPLGIVHGFSRLLVDDLDTLSREEIAEMVEIIQHSSKFMRNLIDDLLDLTAIEAGTLRLEVYPQDPVELAERNVALIRVLAAKKEIEIRLEHDDELPQVVVDAQRFDQVLNNLLSNAIKYSDSGTTITLSVRARDPFVTFAVIDQGQGIAPEFLESMFRPFAKGAVAGTAGEKSTGLGLAIVKRIVEAHDGKLDVVSRPGEGSTFTVLLPAHRAEGEPSSGA